MSEILLEIKNLSISAGELPLVENLNLQLEAGETLAIVGESGSGKSLSSLAIMGLLADNLKKEGSILVAGAEILHKPENDYLSIRGKLISMIFQEPMTALNPTMKCGPQVEEILKLHLKLSKKEAKKETLILFEKVKLPRPENIMDSYPHQISGGQKQRVMIAMAIACKPKLLIADEPTTALDVTVQSEILDLLKDLQNEYGMGLIFISHDLGVVKDIADEVLVMFKGKQMEFGKAIEVFQNPKNEYTKGLLACRPTAETVYKRLPLVADFLAGEGLKFEKTKPEEKKLKALKNLEKPALLEIKNLRRWYQSDSSFFKKSKSFVHAVDDISFSIYTGETLGLVGESGCGKSTLGKILSGLEKADNGEVFYHGTDICTLNKAQWRELHKEIQIIFQDPFSSLNPRLSVGDAIAEVLEIHKKAKGKECKQKVEELLKKVGLEASYYDRFPHEFSGGQRQRIGIARALALEPRFIVCDESVSALDVSVQAQIINLLNDLKDDFGFTYLFISHDLSVVKYISDRIMVMKNGKIVESQLADELYHSPKEEYTRKLINSISN